MIGDNSEAVLTIEANDNPHGVVEFTNDNNRVYEDGDSIASIMIFRR